MGERRGKMATLKVGRAEFLEMGERQDGLPEGGELSEMEERQDGLPEGGELSEMEERLDGLPEGGKGGVVVLCQHAVPVVIQDGDGLDRPVQIYSVYTTCRKKNEVVFT